MAPEVTPQLLLPSFVLIPLLGLSDETLVLAARAEHYYVALVCMIRGVAFDRDRGSPDQDVGGGVAELLHR